MTGRVLVLGGTGCVGAALVNALAGRGTQVAAATRRPHDARPGEVPGEAVRVRFDYDAPETFVPALAEVDRVFLMVRPGDDEAHLTAIPFLEAVERAGVQRVVALTAMGVERMEGAALRRIERRLEESALAWTVLRPNFFMQIFARDALLEGIRASGVIRIPAGDAALSFIDVRDIADVAATALTTSGHEGQAYTLTGSEALTHEAVAGLISEVTGRAVRYEPLGDDRSASELAAAGLGADRIARLLGFYRAVRAGWCQPVSPDVAGVLGRPPRTMASFVGEHRGIWLPGAVRAT
jgi:uncharacterized protein YbjT (DUF2867 family)